MSTFRENRPYDDCMWNPTVRLLINRFLSYLNVVICMEYVTIALCHSAAY